MLPLVAALGAKCGRCGGSSAWRTVKGRAVGWKAKAIANRGDCLTRAVWSVAARPASRKACALWGTPLPPACPPCPLPLRPARGGAIVPVRRPCPVPVAVSGFPPAVARCGGGRVPAGLVLGLAPVPVRYRSPAVAVAGSGCPAWPRS